MQRFHRSVDLICQLNPCPGERMEIRLVARNNRDHFLLHMFQRFSSHACFYLWSLHQHSLAIKCIIRFHVAARRKGGR